LIKTSTPPVADRSPALTLYRGKVMHARMRPLSHRFTYSIASILIDLDRLEEAGRQSWLFSVNKWNLVSFQEADFGPRDGSNLRQYCDSLLAEAGIDPPYQVQLLCYPRVLGYGFNPISVYFCTNLTAGGETVPVALIYEVRNTFGEYHTYVQPIETGQLSPSGIRQEADKLLYVSPFLGMDMHYKFRVKCPGDDVSIRILETNRGEPVLSATFFGRKIDANSVSIGKTVLQTLGLTWKVTAGIHFEALKLWIKGLKIQPRNPHRWSHSFPDGTKKAGRAEKPMDAARPGM